MDTWSPPVGAYFFPTDSYLYRISLFTLVSNSLTDWLTNWLTTLLKMEWFYLICRLCRLCRICRICRLCRICRNAEYAEYAEYLPIVFLVERPKIWDLWIRIKYQLADLSRPFGLVYNILDGGITPDVWLIKVHTYITFESTESMLSFEPTLAHQRLGDHPIHLVIHFRPYFHLKILLGAIK